MSITANQLAMPCPPTLVRERRYAALMGTIALLLTLATLLLAASAGVGSASVTGFIGEVTLTAAAAITMFGMSTQIRTSRLDKDGNPIFPMWNMPGSHWVYTDATGSELPLSMIRVPGRVYTDITIWRSVRVPVIMIGMSVYVIGTVTIVLVALGNNLMAF